MSLKADLCCSDLRNWSSFAASSLNGFVTSASRGRRLDSSFLQVDLGISSTAREVSGQRWRIDVDFRAPLSSG